MSCVGTFTLAAATVDPGTEAFNPRPLIPYMESLGVPYHYLATPIMDMAAAGHMKGDSICAFCSRMKRGALYTCCRWDACTIPPFHATSLTVVAAARAILLGRLLS